MAKVSGGALSFGVSGTVGDVLTFATWKGRPYVRRKVIPANPNTPAQIGVRAAMKWGGQVWATLSPSDQATWDAKATQGNFSGFNAFMKTNAGDWSNGMGFQRQDPAETAVAAVIPTLPTASVAGRQVTIGWKEPATGTLFGSVVHISQTTGFAPASGNTAVIVDSETNGADNEAVLATLKPGVYYYRVRCFDVAGIFGPATAQATFTVV